MFEMVGIRHRYGAVTAVDVPEWRAAAGDAWLLAGQSGSGKSTVLHILAGLTRPTVGSVIVGGTDLAALTESERDRWRGRNVGLVPQRLHLVGALGVRDNLRLAQTLAGLAVDDAHAAQALELLRGQAIEVGATLVVASHDARVKSLLPNSFVLPASEGGHR